MSGDWGLLVGSGAYWWGVGPMMRVALLALSLAACAPSPASSSLYPHPWPDERSRSDDGSLALSAFPVGTGTPLRRDALESLRDARGFDLSRSSGPPPVVDADEVGVFSPVAGNLWQVHVAPGDPVVAGPVLAVLEAMKMEIQVIAPQAGIIHRRVVAPGQSLQAGQVLLTLRAVSHPGSGA